MSKIIIFYLFFLFSASAAAINVADKEVLQRIIDNFSHECLGEPAWPISLPVENDPWLSGRLAALAEAGLAHPAWSDSRPVWLLTPAGNGSAFNAGDRCYGRMLLRQGPQEVHMDH